MMRMRSVASLLAVLLAMALVPGCQMGAGFGGTKKEPSGAFNMADMPVAELVRHWGHSTAVSRDPETDCEMRIYRARSGLAKGPLLCADSAESATGRWSVLGGGAYCLVWRNQSWGNACYAWTHLGGGQFAWERISGAGGAASGEWQDYAANMYGM